MHVAVAQNLFNALAALTQVNVAELLWADALCINQADKFERSSQVLMMGEILLLGRGGLRVAWTSS
jgi:hypothetical protein